MPEFFIEIGSEEIPSGYVQPALEYMCEELASFFSSNRIQSETPQILGTPRRLVVSVKGVDALQEDSVDLFYGPNVSVAFDDKGEPTKAAIGFARGKGLDVSSLTRESTPKGEVVCARVEKKAVLPWSISMNICRNSLARSPSQKKCVGGARHIHLRDPCIGSQQYLMASLYTSVLMASIVVIFHWGTGF